MGNLQKCRLLTLFYMPTTAHEPGKKKPPYSDGFKSSYGSALNALAIANRLRADILPGSDFPVSTACICVTDTPDKADSWWSVRC